MLVVNKVSVDLQKAAYPTMVDAVQGDRNTRCIEVSLYSDGTAWQIPDGVMVAMRYRKPDMTCGYYDTLPDGTTAWSVQDNVITMLLAPQMLTVAGTVFAQLEMIHGNNILGTFTVCIRVEADPAAEVRTSENYINWLQWMEDELKARMNEMLETGDFTVPSGPADAPAAILSQAVEYQASADYKTEPTGEWSSVVPDVAQGEYLWTRTTVTYNSGSPVVSYSISRFGKDGLGSVVSVAGVSPDANGNVPLDASRVKALPIGGGYMEGPINMNGQKLSGLNAPTKDDEPATKGYADNLKPDLTGYATETFVTDTLKNKTVNNFTTTEEGFVADARTVTILNDKINTVLTNSMSVVVSGTTSTNRLSKYGKIAIATLYLSGLSITANVNIAKINDAEFLPIRSERVPVLANLGGTWQMIFGMINLDGTVQLAWGSASVSALYFNAVYMTN